MQVLGPYLFWLLCRCAIGSLEVTDAGNLKIVCLFDRRGKSLIWIKFKVTSVWGCYIERRIGLTGPDPRVHANFEGGWAAPVRLLNLRENSLHWCRLIGNCSKSGTLFPFWK